MICNKKAQNNNEIEKMLSNQISNKKGKTLTLEEDQFIRLPSPPPKQRTFVKNVNVMSITEFNNISYTFKLFNDKRKYYTDSVPTCTLAKG